MIRGTFANIRMRNPDGSVEGGVTRATSASRTEQHGHLRRRREVQGSGQSRSWFAGKEYGSGAPATGRRRARALLGVRAVIAESYERIHRSNLVGMGVLPLQFLEGQNTDTLGLDGTEYITITGLDALNDGPCCHCARARGAERRTLRRGSLSSLTLRCASTPPVRRTTTVTAASCRTC